MESNISRRTALASIAAAVAGIALGGRTLPALARKTPIAIYKDPNCGCCAKWVDHLTANGFVCTVTNKSPAEMDALKKQHKVAANLQSCHTGIVGGYVVEGHVPAGDISRMLAAKPKGIVGLTIPGMPSSAPGMDMKPFVPYTVLSFTDRGVTAVFAKHEKA
jgi:hypothetical protein